MRSYTDAETFEDAYAKAEFSELVRLVLLAATALRGFRDRSESDRHLPGATQAGAS